VAAESVLVAEEAPDVLLPVDLALVLKTIPCLEHVDKSAGQRLLDGLPARNVLVSFPLRSLGGAQKGMRRTYEGRMKALVEGRPWQVRRFEFPTELAFLVTR
jgi:16S rRNA (guanine(1405)-N(7))-methyltransferase